MFTVYHHLDQHRLGDLGFAVGLSVHIQVTESGAFEHTDFAVEWFYSMNVVVVFLQSLAGVELFITFCTFLRLFPLRVFPLDMFPQINSAPENCLTVAADKLRVGVVSVDVKNQLPLAIENSPALSAQVTLGSFLMDLLDVIVPGDLALETFPADLTGHRVDMAAVHLHRVELQGAVGEEVPAAGGADVLHD